MLNSCIHCLVHTLYLFFQGTQQFCHNRINSEERRISLWYYSVDISPVFFLNFEGTVFNFFTVP